MHGMNKLNKEFLMIRQKRKRRHTKSVHPTYIKSVHRTYKKCTSDYKKRVYSATYKLLPMYST